MSDRTIENPIENPWVKLPRHAPYVLKQDWPYVKKFNDKHKGRATEIQTDLLPEPYLGKPDAPVVLLNLNPGFDECDRIAHGSHVFIKRSRQNLLHNHPAEYPFYLLDPCLSFAPGFCWWRKILKHLIDAEDWPIEQRLQRVADRIFCVEYFPYHSKKWGDPTKDVIWPSQKYSFSLVEKAIDGKKLILILHGYRQWHAAAKRLESYDNCYIVKSARNATVTTANLRSSRTECDGAEGFKQAVKRIYDAD